MPDDQRKDRIPLRIGIRCELRPGQWRRLTEIELATLRRANMPPWMLDKTIDPRQAAPAWYRAHPSFRFY